MDIQTMPYSRLERLEQRCAELEKTLEVVEKQRDRFITKQKERIAELTNNCVNHGSYIHQLEQRIAELEADNERLRGALKAISYRGTYGGDLCSCWRVARDALFTQYRGNN